tara:strand:+ start:456 stop:1898 length:1443 start_codon:yes stop_codon:yes gene_type:complete
MKNNIINTFGKDVLIYSASDFITKIIAFVVIPFYAAYLGPALLGSFDLISITISLISMIGICGMNNSLSRFFWEYKSGMDYQIKMYSTGLIFVLVLNIAIYTTCATFLHINQSEIFYNLDVDKNFLFIVLLLIPLSNLFTYSQTMLRLRFKPAAFMFAGIIGFSIPPIVASLLMLFYSLKLEAIFLSSIIFLFLGNLFLIWLNRGYLKAVFDKDTFKEFFNYGSPFIFTGLAYWVFTSLDRYLISYFMSVSDVGVYSVSSKVALIPLFIFNAFGSAWSPYTIKLKSDYSDKDYKLILGKVLNIFLTLGLILSGFFALFSGEIVSSLFPKEFFDAGFVSIFLCFSVFFNFTTQVTGIGISLSKRTFIFSISTFAVAIINLIGNFILIPKLGILGAAVSTVLSYGILTIIYFYFTMRLFSITIEVNKLLFIIFITFSIFYLSTMLFQLQINSVSLIKVFILLALTPLAYNNVKNLSQLLGSK